MLRALILTRMPYDGLIIMVFCDGSVHLIIDREGEEWGDDESYTSDYRRCDFDTRCNTHQIREGSGPRMTNLEVEGLDRRRISNVYFLEQEVLTIPRSVNQ